MNYCQNKAQINNKKNTTMDKPVSRCLYYIAICFPALAGGAGN